MSEHFLDYTQITKCFEKAFKDNHKTSFQQWYLDLSYKSSVAVTVFSLGLFFSISMPVLTPCVLILAVIQLYVDKYNLLYIYPLEFESQTISRKALVKKSCFAIVLFQTGMALLGLTRQKPESNKISVYWLGFVLV